MVLCVLCKKNKDNTQAWMPNPCFKDYRRNSVESLVNENKITLVSEEVMLKNLKPSKMRQNNVFTFRVVSQLNQFQN